MDCYVILVSDGYGEGTEAAGVFDRQPTKAELEEAKRVAQAQYARWEKFQLNKVECGQRGLG